MRVSELFQESQSVNYKMRILLVNNYKNFRFWLNVWVSSSWLEEFLKDFNEFLIKGLKVIFVAAYFQDGMEVNAGHLSHLSNVDFGNFSIHCRNMLYVLNSFYFTLLIANGCTLMKCAKQTCNYIISYIIFTIFEHCFHWKRKIIVCIDLFIWFIINAYRFSFKIIFSVIFC